MKPARRWRWSALLLASGLGAYGQSTEVESVSPVPALEAAPAESPAKPSLTYAGQTFELAQSRSGERLSTDEYTLPGEKIADWTQLVTVQRLTGPAATNLEQLVQFFRTRLKTDEATLDVLSETAKGRTFAVRFPARGATEEQVMICLAFVDPTQSRVLNVVQYAVKPQRVGASVASTQIRAWKDRFVGQTAAP